MEQNIVVLDFGSQYTQLIARRVRESKVFSKVYPFYAPFEKVSADKPAGIIFSGSPANVYAKGAPIPDRRFFSCGIPILGICYGMQLLSHKLGGRVHKSKKREYGFSKLHVSKLKAYSCTCASATLCFSAYVMFQGFLALTSFMIFVLSKMVSLCNISTSIGKEYDK